MFFMQKNDCKNLKYKSAKSLLCRQNGARVKIKLLKNMQIKIT